MGEHLGGQGANLEAMAQIFMRPAVLDDAWAIHEVESAAVSTWCSVYDESQVRAWKALLHPGYHVDSLITRQVLVAVVISRVVGFGQLDAAAGRIPALYVHPDWARRGIGRRLLGQLEVLACDAGLGAVAVSASSNAVGFYEGAGYQQVGPVSFQLAGGVTLSALEMSKRLGGARPGRGT